MRRHGAEGSFVSKWTIDKGDLSVVGAEDLIRQVATWDTLTSAYNAPAAGIAISRLCSADLAGAGAFFDEASGKGYAGRLLLNGEEIGDEGRAFAHLLNGTSYELPYLGKLSWENVVAHPSTGDKTVVVGLDDSSPGQVYVYVGDKQSSGNPVEKAGLSGGALYGVKVSGYAAEPAGGIPAGTPFALEAVGLDGSVASRSGAQIQADSVADGITQFLRPEDGAWDPDNPNDFYFATTNSIDAPSRLWRLRFTDAANPLAGGTITAVLEGGEGQHMMDNLTVHDGRVLIQEDPGSKAPAGQSNYLAKVWAYDIASDSLTEIAEHDPARFTTGLPGFLTKNEESSGIIPAPFLGRGWYLADVQAHLKYTFPPEANRELVEPGQLLALHVPPGKFR